jgi:hypothetical protein
LDISTKQEGDDEDEGEEEDENGTEDENEEGACQNVRKGRRYLTRGTVVTRARCAVGSVRLINARSKGSYSSSSRLDLHNRRTCKPCLVRIPPIGVPSLIIMIG